MYSDVPIYYYYWECMSKYVTLKKGGVWRTSVMINVNVNSSVFFI